MRRLLAACFALMLAALPAAAGSIPSREELQPLCDSLSVRLLERTGVRTELEISRVLRRGKKIDVYFNSKLGDCPWRDGDVSWLRGWLAPELRREIPGYQLGEVFAGRVKIGELVTDPLESSGKSPRSRHHVQERERHSPVHEVDGPWWPKGLSGRNIAVWQSHGIYYNEEQDQWMWQRARLHRTVEDMFTQSFVLPYLIPMLERAGAWVVTPRERDTGRMEYITDNDPSFEGERSGCMRRAGTYSERGRWSDVAGGFADVKREYLINENPFTLGSSRSIACSPDSKAEARWSPGILERGTYAVYVSYVSLEDSSPEALYTVHHLGGETAFKVDQRHGGSIWMYLGSFDMGPDSFITLSGAGPRGKKVSADAVKVGGGMGKIARGPEGAERISGYPSYIEGALYNMVWSGTDTTLTRLQSDDYHNDFGDRGRWVDMLVKDKGLPFDLTLAFHSDAGVTPNDSTVGTLTIYSLRGEKGRRFTAGGDRMASRQMADYIQSQICDDIRSQFDPEWQRRGTSDRGYSEARTSGTPAVLLELLSHQNFADMRYGHDPAFKFTTCRAVYKGMLKFLSAYYGCSYTVQPLPVQRMAARLDGSSKVRLSWKGVEDPLEPTATPTYYIVYTRVDDGAFDGGRKVKDNSVRLDIRPGHIYSYRVEACNEGGRSFPSETVSVGVPSGSRGKVLVVNNFTRISAPAWIDGEQFAGFDARIDSGVPYMSDISYIGENYEFRRALPWFSDDNAGHGASWDDHAGEIIAGNTFDYPAVHGQSLMELGYSFESMSAGAFCLYGARDADAVDLICGKQLTVPVGPGRNEYQVFPKALREAISQTAERGTGIIVSGADIATDVWSYVYPMEHDVADKTECARFVSGVLGYKLGSTAGTNVGSVDGMEFWSSPNEVSYSVEMPDALKPASPAAEVALRYDRTGLPAAIAFTGTTPSGTSSAGTGTTYRVFSLGVPIEALKDPSDRTTLLHQALDFVTE